VCSSRTTHCLTTEATSIIGQWLPVDSGGPDASLARELRQLVGDCTSLALHHLLPALARAPAGRHATVAALQRLLLAARGLGWVGAHGGAAAAVAGRLPTDGEQAAVLAACEELLGAASNGPLALGADEGQQAALRLAAEAERLRRSFEAAARQQQQGLAFAWAESDLVAAIKAGDWVSCQARQTQSSPLALPWPPTFQMLSSQSLDLKRRSPPSTQHANSAHFSLAPIARDYFP
jgi:hypothetical protein